MTKTTRQQRESLYIKWKLNDQGMSYRQFRKAVMGSIGMDDAVVAPWCGFFLVVEKDGYCHS